MQQTFISIEDNILNYIYFNKESSLKEIEQQIIHSPLTRKANVSFSIFKLEKEKLIFNESGNIKITDEGKRAVENYNSYDDYISFKTSR